MQNGILGADRQKSMTQTAFHEGGTLNGNAIEVRNWRPRRKLYQSLFCPMRRAGWLAGLTWVLLSTGAALAQAEAGEDDPDSIVVTGELPKRSEITRQARETAAVNSPE